MNEVEKLIGKTKTGIIEILLSGVKKAENIAQVLKINVSAVRHHLEDLVFSGLVTSSFIKEGVGRPRKVYFLTEKGQELLFDTSRKMLSSLLSTIDIKAPEIAESSVREVASKFSEELQAQKGRLDEKFREKGFFVVQEGDKIVTYSCPFLYYAKGQPKLFCVVFHGEIIKNFYRSSNVRLIETMAKGSNKCVHQLEIYK
jgi:DeoR family suf operon transcriptional repressor